MAKGSVTVLLAFALGATLSLAQLDEPRKPVAKKAAVMEKTDAQKLRAVQRDQALDYLNLSRALNDQISKDGQLIELLHLQIIVAGRLDKPLARKWAHQLFELGARTTAHDRDEAQGLAVDSLARTDPDEALILLLLMEPSSLQRPKGYFGTDLVMSNIDSVFTTMIREKGKAAMPRILNVAEVLGGRGRYPYPAVMLAARFTSNKEIGDSTAGLMLLRFQQGLDPATAAADFEEMFALYSTLWPKELLKSVEETAIEGILNYPVAESPRKKYGGPIQIALRRMASLIKTADPDALEGLLRKYPALAKADDSEYYRPQEDIREMLVSSDHKQSQIDDLRYQVSQDVEKVRQTIAGIRDPALRGEAYAAVAQELAETDPKNSAEFTVEAEKLAAEKGLETQFRAACAKLQSSAANGNRAEVSAALDSAFLLADKLLRSERAYDDHYIVGLLSDAVHQSVKLEPGLTLAHIESIYLPFERAQLYAEAAMAVAPVMEPGRPTEAKAADKVSTQANN